MAALLVGCAAFTIWRLHKYWRELLRFDALEWAAIAILGITLFSRFWIIRDQPYPAWSDSLHHTILTQLTAVQGKLPTDMQPYFPIPLDEYHLGLYALTASVQWLAQVPAYTALLITAQVLNGLCGISVYLVLDHKIGRLGALAGLAVAGLFSFLPASYVNWGRFTQLASGTILLIAWLTTSEAITVWKSRQTLKNFYLVWITLVAALLNAAVFLLHFRMAGFYLPLIGLTILYELIRERRDKGFFNLVIGISVIAILAFLCILPALVPALSAYLTHQTAAAPQEIGLSIEEQTQMTQSYYVMPLSAIPQFSVGNELLILAGIGSLWGFVRRRKLIILYSIWMVLLVLMGNAYLLNIPLLNLSNLSGITIMFYLPVAMIIGAALNDLTGLIKGDYQNLVIRLIAGIILSAGFIASYYRASEIEPYRYFVTPADVTAMQWIKTNTPTDAVFSINTYLWLPGIPHGTDAGYWIPYFTGRQTTTGCMLTSLAKPEQVRNVLEMSDLTEQLTKGSIDAKGLHAHGIQYIYIGARGNFSGPGLDAKELSQDKEFEMVYDQQGVQIFKVK